MYLGSSRASVCSDSQPRFCAQAPRLDLVPLFPAAGWTLAGASVIGDLTAFAIDGKLPDAEADAHAVDTARAAAGLPLLSKLQLRTSAWEGDRRCAVRRPPCAQERTRCQLLSPVGRTPSPCACEPQRKEDDTSLGLVARCLVASALTTRRPLILPRPPTRTP